VVSRAGGGGGGVLQFEKDWGARRTFQKLEKAVSVPLRAVSLKKSTLGTSAIPLRAMSRKSIARYSLVF